MTRRECLSLKNSDISFKKTSHFLTRLLLSVRFQNKKEKNVFPFILLSPVVLFLIKRHQPLSEYLRNYRGIKTDFSINVTPDAFYCTLPKYFLRPLCFLNPFVLLRNQTVGLKRQISLMKLYSNWSLWFSISIRW